MAALCFSSILLVFNVISCGYGTTVEFFEQENFEGEMYHIATSVGCTNLPTSVQSLRGSIKTTECIVAYLDRGCHHDNQAFVVKSEESRLGELLTQVGDGESHNVSVKSFGNCEDLVHGRKRRTVTDISSISYDATVFHMEINHKGYGNLKGKIMPWPTFTKRIVINNSTTTTITNRQIGFGGRFTESAKFQFYYVLNKMSSIEFESQALKQFEASLAQIPYSLSKATLELKAGLPRAFRWGSDNLYKDKPTYTVETKEYFSIYQTFDIPKCQKYKGTLHADYMRKIVIHFTCRLKITAKILHTQRKLKATEIRERLERDPDAPFKFLNGDPNADEFTAVVEEPAWFTPEYISNIIYNHEVDSYNDCPCWHRC